MSAERMSAAEAKARQGYIERGGSCGRCQHYTSKYMLPTWMQQQNDELKKQGLPPKWDFNYQEEVQRRCSLGDFPVRKLAVCAQYKRKEKE
jgi:hypothetical protein